MYRTKKGVKHNSQKAATGFADTPTTSSESTRRYQLGGCAQDPSEPSPDIRGKGGLIQTLKVAPSELNEE